MVSFGRHVKITAAWAATSATDPAATAPGSFAAEASAAGLTSCTTRGTPPLARLVAIGMPIVPSPMNPTRSAIIAPRSPRHAPVRPRTVVGQRLSELATAEIGGLAREPLVEVAPRDARVHGPGRSSRRRTGFRCPRARRARSRSCRARRPAPHRHRYRGPAGRSATPPLRTGAGHRPGARSSPRRRPTGTARAAGPRRDRSARRKAPPRTRQKSRSRSVSSVRGSSGSR